MDESELGKLIAVAMIGYRNVGYKQHARPTRLCGSQAICHSWLLDPGNPCRDDELSLILPGKLLFHCHKGYLGDSGMLNGRHHFGNLGIDNVLIGI